MSDLLTTVAIVLVAVVFVWSVFSDRGRASIVGRTIWFLFKDPTCGFVLSVVFLVTSLVGACYETVAHLIDPSRGQGSWWLYHALAVFWGYAALRDYRVYRRKFPRVVFHYGLDDAKEISTKTAVVETLDYGSDDPQA